MAENKNKQRTYIMVKPDGVERGLTGEIIKRFEQKGFKMVAMKFMQVELFCPDINNLGSTRLCLIQTHSLPTARRGTAEKALW